MRKWRRGGWVSAAGVIFPQFSSADAQMSDADVFSDSRAEPFQERLDSMKAAPPGLIGSPKMRLKWRRCLPTQPENRSLIGQLDASPSQRPFFAGCNTIFVERRFNSEGWKKPNRTYRPVSAGSWLGIGRDIEPRPKKLQTLSRTRLKWGTLPKNKDFWEFLTSQNSTSWCEDFCLVRKVKH